MKRSEIDLVEKTVELVRVLPDALGDGLQAGFHLLAILAANHNDHVFIIAELVEVSAPALLIGLIGVDEVIALSAETQASAEGVDGDGREEEADGQNPPWPPGDKRHHAREQAVHQPRLVAWDH